LQTGQTGGQPYSDLTPYKEHEKAFPDFYNIVPLAGSNYSQTSGTVEVKVSA